MPRNGQQLLNHIERNNISESAQREVISKMVDAIDNAARRHELIGTDGGERLFHAGNHVMNYAHGAFELNEEKINKALDNMGRNSLRDALLATVPGMEPPITYYDLFAQDPETKKAIDDGLKVLNDYADLNWDLSFTVPQENLINIQQDAPVNAPQVEPQQSIPGSAPRQSDFSELSGGRVAQGFVIPTDEEINNIINEVKQTANQYSTGKNVSRKEAQPSGFKEMSLDTLMGKLDKSVTTAKNISRSQSGYSMVIEDKGLMKSLDKFTTKRKFVERSSTAHQQVMDAVDKMQNMKKSIGDLDKAIEDKNAPLESDKLDNVVKWMTAAQDMFYEADMYYNKRSPLTFAGRDRKNGAKELRDYAAHDILKATDAAESVPGYKGDRWVKKVYEKIAENKAEDAKTQMNKLDISKPTEEKNGRSVEKQIEDQKLKVRSLMLDSIAAYAAKQDMQKNEHRNLEGGNFHNIRTHLEYDVMLTGGLFNLIENKWPNNKAALQELVADPQKMIGELQKIRGLDKLSKTIEEEYTVTMPHRHEVISDARTAEINAEEKKRNNARIM